MYALADKYGVFGLKTLAVQKFRAQFQREPWPCNGQILSIRCESLLEAIRVIWESTPEGDKGLRGMVLGIVTTPAHKYTGVLGEISEMNIWSTLQSLKGFRELMLEVPSFGADVLARENLKFV